MRLRILGSASDTFSLGIDIDPKVFNGCLAGSGHGAPRGAGSQVFFSSVDFFFLFSSAFFLLLRGFLEVFWDFLRSCFRPLDSVWECSFLDVSVIFLFFRN